MFPDQIIVYKDFKIWDFSMYVQLILYGMDNVCVFVDFYRVIQLQNTIAGQSLLGKLKH